MKKLIKFFDSNGTKNFFDEKNTPEYWTVLNICY